MEKSLNTFARGQSGTVKSIGAKGAIRRRLFDMGITPGTTIVMRKLAPLGDPIEINVRGYDLSIRKADAATVLLDVK